MSHTHELSTNNKSLIFGIILNGAYTIVGFVFGLLTGSLALIADAIHNLTDNVTLGISLAANRIAERKANSRKTFGYGRATILAAAVNASFLIGIALFIVNESVQRLQNPVEVDGGIIAAVAFGGIVVNATVAYMLSKNRQDLNMRSAFTDQLFDALSSLGAMLAGLIIMFTGIQFIDTVVALIVVVLLLYNTIKILKEAANILLEGVPDDVDINRIQAAITSIDKVNEVDDMHIWAIRSGYNTLSCHVVIDEQELKSSRAIVETIKETLRREHGIPHATIEIELESDARHISHEKH
ncbi:cation transporter [Candidatus Saccharibacteria bacterium]|nr:cation transporter [Candidatus Saccharibacteria bacterium]